MTHDVEEAVFVSQHIYVFSSHPGRMTEEVVLPLAADRTAEVLREPESHALSDDLRDLLRRHAAVPVA